MTFIILQLSYVRWDSNSINIYHVESTLCISNAANTLLFQVDSQKSSQQVLRTILLRSIGPGGRGAAHLRGRGSGGHLVSLQRRARLLGPETPCHQPAGSSRHSPDKHLPERAGLRAGAAGEARPRGRGLNSDKSPGSARPPAPPGSSPRGAPGRRLPPSAATRLASWDSSSPATSAPLARHSAAPGASGLPRSPPGGSSEAGFPT